MKHVITRAQQKQIVLEDIAAARRVWEDSGVRFPDFLSDRDAFYRGVKQALLPMCIEAGIEEKVFLEAMQEYARADWIRSGFDGKDFDRRFMFAKWRASTKALLGAAGGFLGYVFVVLIKAAFSVEHEPDNTLDVVGFLFLCGIAVSVAAAAVIEIRNRLKNPSNGVVTLNLK